MVAAWAGIDNDDDTDYYSEEEELDNYNYEGFKVPSKMYSGFEYECVCRFTMKMLSNKEIVCLGRK